MKSCKCKKQAKDGIYKRKAYKWLLGHQGGLGTFYVLLFVTRSVFSLVATLKYRGLNSKYGWDKNNDNVFYFV